MLGQNFGGAGERLTDLFLPGLSPFGAERATGFARESAQGLSVRRYSNWQVRTGRNRLPCTCGCIRPGPRPPKTGAVSAVCPALLFFSFLFFSFHRENELLCFSFHPRHRHSARPVLRKWLSRLAKLQPTGYVPITTTPTRRRTRLSARILSPFKPAATSAFSSCPPASD
jgi:hypothetical protein